MKKDIFNKTSLVEGLYKQGLGPTKVACEEAVDYIFTMIMVATKDGKKVSLPPIGIFQSKTKAKSEARNPKTGAKVVVPEHQKVKFTASKQFKEFINN